MIFDFLVVKLAMGGGGGREGKLLAISQIPSWFGWHLWLASSWVSQNFDSILKPCATKSCFFSVQSSLSLKSFIVSRSVLDFQVRVFASPQVSDYNTI